MSLLVYCWKPGPYPSSRRVQSKPGEIKKTGSSTRDPSCVFESARYQVPERGFRAHARIARVVRTLFEIEAGSGIVGAVLFDIRIARIVFLALKSQLK